MTATRLTGPLGCSLRVPGQSGWAELGLQSWGCSMRSPPGAADPGLWKEGRLAVDWSPRFCSDLKLLEDKSWCLPSSPPGPSPVPGRRRESSGAHFPSSRHLLSNQELLGCVSLLSLVAMEAVLEKASLPTIKPFLSESGSGHLAFQQGRQRGRGRWEPSSSHPCSSVSPARLTLVPGPHT